MTGNPWRAERTNYYGGHGDRDTSWGTIMGTGYNRNVSSSGPKADILPRPTSRLVETLAVNFREITISARLTMEYNHCLCHSLGHPLRPRTYRATPLLKRTWHKPTNHANKGAVLERNNGRGRPSSFVTGTGPSQSYGHPVGKKINDLVDDCVAW
jgi:hypothetical protein